MSGVTFEALHPIPTVFADAVSRHHGVVFVANAKDGGAIVGFDVPEP